MKITPAMKRCLEFVAGFNGPVTWRRRRRIVREDVWQRCHDAGLLEIMYRPMTDTKGKIHQEYLGSLLTDAGRKELDRIRQLL